MHPLIVDFITRAHPVKDDTAIKTMCVAEVNRLYSDTGYTPSYVHKLIWSYREAFKEAGVSPLFLKYFHPYKEVSQDLKNDAKEKRYDRHDDKNRYAITNIDTLIAVAT